MTICPTCNGVKTLMAAIDSEIREVDCHACKGTGAVDETIAGRIRAGQRMRDDRASIDVRHPRPNSGGGGMTKIFDFSMCIAIWIVEAIWGRDANDEDEAVEAETIEAIVRRMS